MAARTLSRYDGLTLAALAAVAVLGVPQPSIGAWFVLTVAVAALLLWGLTRLLLLAASRLSTEAASPCALPSPTCTAQAHPHRG